MAIYHLKIKTISRAAGQSAVAASAYRACQAMRDERTGQPADYARKRGHLAGGLVGWCGDAACLWNTAEAVERRKDAKTAREVVIALPAGLALLEQEALVKGFAESLAWRHGVAVQWDIHRPDRGGDARNVHAHLLLTTRRVVAGRLGEKTRELDVKPTSGQAVEAWRADWQVRVNAVPRPAPDRTNGWTGAVMSGGGPRTSCRARLRRQWPTWGRRGRPLSGGVGGPGPGFTTIALPRPPSSNARSRD